ncbi:MAG TPA: vWA domain-containing protein [Bryobacteraceae bacterium]|nr:vWA domain-containing protein [Bryobacteraceae bacterium]
MLPSSSKKRERGFALIVNAAMLVFTVAAVGLALDVGSIYMIKGRLSAAVDAAALAAGRSVNLANTVQAAQTAATNMANQFFSANFPAGYLGTTGSPTVNPTFEQEVDGSGNPDGILNITVAASVNAPTYFMNIFGVRSIPVSATGTATRRGLVMLLVLDESSSMNTATVPSACQAMVSAARNFITKFSPYDRIGMVKFDMTAHLAYTPSTSYGDGSLDTAIANITCGGNTNTTSALEMAYRQIQAQNLPLAQNTIILFTDGSPNGISCDFPLRKQVDTRWGPAVTNPVAPNQPGGSLWNQPYSPNGCPSSNGGNNGACVNMPATCPANGAAVRGTLAQGSNQNSYGGSINGLYQPMDSDPSVVLPVGCGYQDSNTRQMIAYIPDQDIYGNSTHGVAATGNGPTVAGGLVTRDTWLYQTINLCSSDPNVQPSCKNVGDFWNNHGTIGSVSNKFTAGPYNGFFRPDQPNTIVAVSMNTAMAEANRIRGNATYHIKINAIYLTGNGTDAVDREFLPIIANFPTIPALPYDPVTYQAYVNPAFQQNQEQGQYLVTADRNQLNALFSQLASEVLRLSH